MVWIPAGVFTMGSNDHYPEEAPAHQVQIDGFWIDRAPVTNRQFQAFVKETSYVTIAERQPVADDYPDAQPQLLVPGSAVFNQPERPVNLNIVSWWHYEPGASWRHPEGPGSNLNGRWSHPVVHVAFEDVTAYAQWCGKSLPTEAQFEYAARGGLENEVFVWGSDAFPDGRPMANTWQGQFPWQNLEIDGFSRTSPVGSFDANGYGLQDMTGNVWEWTQDWYTPNHADEGQAVEHAQSCHSINPRGGSQAGSLEGSAPENLFPRKVVKGGSFLCAPNYCFRFRPAARHPESVDTSTCHIGFRCVINSEQ
jgi:formylglycine-generating enzyme required for sulfatase activity